MLVGNYINDLINCFVASAVSGQHAVTIMEPGWGKTTLLLKMAEKIFGFSETAILRLSPGTSPSKVYGSVNPEILLRTGRQIHNTDHPLFDPKVKLGVIDELGRANDPTFDALLQALDRIDIQDRSERPVMWATSNWSPQSKRNEALKDRFTIWHQAKPDLGDMDDLITSFSQNGKMRIDVELPSLDDVLGIRSIPSGGEKFNSLFKELMEILIFEISQEIKNREGKKTHGPAKINPRLVEQWYFVFFRHAVWVTGRDDPDHIPAETMSLLPFLYKNATWQDFKIWNHRIRNVVDLNGSQNTSHIEAARLYFSNTLEKVKKNPDSKAIIIANATAKLMSIIDNIDENSKGGKQAIEEINQLSNRLFSESDI